ncbi:MAG: DNA internalization-related competence protein ComEC/Rec2 [Dehalococcoidaceae bacterium]|nr:DNA internalization-related competence protein ComEC/Rec2 [Dehalococcoidaceae bacterium]
MKLVFFSACFISGIIAGSFVRMPSWVIFAGLLPLLMLFFPGIKKYAVPASLGLALILAGVVYSPSEAPENRPWNLSFYNGSVGVELRGIIDREVELRDRTQHLRVSALEIRVDGFWQKTDGEVLVFVPRYPEYSYGDEVLLEGKLEAPPVFMHQITGEVEFDYAGYLASQDIFSVMSYPRISVLSHNNASPALGALYRLKQALSLSLGRALPEPQASLSQGMLLGMRQGIPEEIQQDFSRTGTYHLLAISGLHLGIIAAFSMNLGVALFGRRRFFYIWFSLAVIWVYALISGANPPVIRAGIMASTFLLAELAGRQRYSLPALGLAAAVMTAADPRVLFTASFQMSFAAMAGIAMVYPRLKTWGAGRVEGFIKLPDKIKTPAALLYESLALSLAATLFVAPLVAYYFSIISFIGPATTLAALPSLPLIIAASAITAVLGLFWSLPAMITGWFTSLFSAYMLGVVGLASNMPLAYIDNASLPGGAVAGYYLVVVTAILALSRRRVITGWLKSRIEQDRRLWQSGRVHARCLAGISVVLVVVSIILVPACSPDDDRFKVSFLDIGQGDAVLVSRGSTQILVDGGPSPRKLMQELGRRMPFFDRTIELVVLTHPHADHLNGLVELFKRYEVKQVLYPLELKPAPGYESAAFREWLELIDQKQIPLRAARAGQQFDLGPGRFTVLNPRAVTTLLPVEDVDNNCVVLEIEVGKFAFLLTGDLMWQGELELVLDRMLGKVTVLKAGHHGSDTSSSRELLSVIRPETAVISVGENDYGHPNEAAIGRLSAHVDEILLTGNTGGVTFVTDGNSLWLESG